MIAHDQLNATFLYILYIYIYILDIIYQPSFFETFDGSEIFNSNVCSNSYKRPPLKIKATFCVKIGRSLNPFGTTGIKASFYCVIC